MDLDDLPKVRSTRDQVEATLSLLIQQHAQEINSLLSRS